MEPTRAGQGHGSAYVPRNPARNVLITAALPYANGGLHVGHIAGAYLPADTFARYLRLQGVNVRAVCGSDDYGVAIVMSAAKALKTPAEVARYYNERHRTDLRGLEIEFDVYGATSQNPFHTQLSQSFFLTLLQKGYFEKRSTNQFYDPKNTMFLPDRFVRGDCGLCGAGDQNGDQCEACGELLDTTTLKHPRSALSGEPAEIRSTTHWFLNLSKLQPHIKKWLETAVMREQTRNYVTSILAEPLAPRSMTRDLEWGIPVPIDEADADGKVLYVWFDAPIGYISNTMQLCSERDNDPQKYEEWWKSPDTDIYHFIGEDNTIFHCEIWPAMLAAEGSYQLPRGVIVNHFMNIHSESLVAGEKMSKSRGAAVWIEEYLAANGSSDVLRYYLTMIAPEQKRAVFSLQDMVTRNNSELGAVIGNLFQRVVSFTNKQFGPQVPVYQPEKITPLDLQLLETMRTAHTVTTEAMDNCNFRNGLSSILEFGRACNKYLDERAPWKAIKSDPEDAKVSLAHALSALKFIAVTIAPFLPAASDKMARILNLSVESRKWQAATSGLDLGHPLGEPMILFPRLDVDGGPGPIVD